MTWLLSENIYVNVNCPCAREIQYHPRWKLLLDYDFAVRKGMAWCIHDEGLSLAEARHRLLQADVLKLAARRVELWNEQKPSWGAT